MLMLAVFFKHFCPFLDSFHMLVSEKSAKYTIFNLESVNW